jgi:hypothetical protein
MEKFSENTRKRGRPRLDDLGILKSVGLDVHSRRGKLNKYYFVRAISALRQTADRNTRWPWLAPYGFDTIAAARFPRASVMYKLGRLIDPDTICDAADLFCTGKLTATEAIRLIRAWRLEKPLPEADADELADLLARTIDQYNASHKGLTGEVIQEVLLQIGRAESRGRAFPVGATQRCRRLCG